MLFSNKTNNQQTAESAELQEASSILNKSVNDYFEMEVQRIKEELIKAGIPADEHESFIKDFKKELQADVVKRFKENVHNKALKLTL